MNKTVLLLFSIIVFASCGNDKKPRVVYDTDPNKEATELKKDSTLIEAADLPVQIDSTNYLIHPIGYLKVYGSRSKISFRSNYENTNFVLSRHSNYEITGKLTNLKFQHIDSEKMIPLTEKTLIITSVRFLKEVFDRTKSKYLLYKVIDQDTNKDQKLNHQDITSLYISKIDGSDFIKLTPDYEELINWKILTSKNRLYIKTVQDKNKDGEFDKTDEIHYQYLDLQDKNWEIKYYNPL
ncbi:hypothetical protein [uncultured Aquimarina sp.]|uniref:hypothetical protein n=1 Tax=uncultured Aquimarina sp. TaxID=575652 RepID=UPI002634754B|nr:hypothetical protein [uncultured Aquimarina sp.]